MFYWRRHLSQVGLPYVFEMLENTDSVFSTEEDIEHQNIDYVQKLRVFYMPANVLNSAFSSDENADSLFWANPNTPLGETHQHTPHVEHKR